MQSEKAKKIRLIIRSINQYHNFNFKWNGVRGVPYIYLDSNKRLIFYIASKKEINKEIVKEIYKNLEKKGYHLVTSTYKLLFNRAKRKILIAILENSIKNG